MPFILLNHSSLHEYVPFMEVPEKKRV